MGQQKRKRRNAEITHKDINYGVDKARKNGMLKVGRGLGGGAYKYAIYDIDRRPMCARPFVYFPIAFFLVVFFHRELAHVYG